jgi:hypothetical protein
MKGLWGIVILNLALGAVVWAFNTIQIVGDELCRAKTAEVSPSW